MWHLALFIILKPSLTFTWEKVSVEKSHRVTQDMKNLRRSKGLFKFLKKVSLYIRSFLKNSNKQELFTIPRFSEPKSTFRFL